MIPRTYAQPFKLRRWKVLRRTSLPLMILGIVFLTTTVVAQSQDDRAADRAAIRAHIDSIFQAFIEERQCRAPRNAR